VTEKTCKVCEKTFTSKNPRQIYCSKKCKWKRDNDSRDKEKHKQKCLIYWHSDKGREANKRRLKIWKARYNTDAEFRNNYLKKDKEKRKNNIEIYRANQRKRTKKCLEKKRLNRKYIEKEKQRLKEYRQTENGKLTSAKHHEKRKNYDHKLQEKNIIEGEPVILHHITDDKVIFIPTDLHGLYGWNPKEAHRENLQYIIDQIYNTKIY